VVEGVEDEKAQLKGDEKKGKDKASKGRKNPKNKAQV